uniref:Uncharacterized protein n=1 Tax=Cacopsylla melanoneura TaxID=428564 RepID=A0A8D9BNK4_9HEMI
MHTKPIISEKVVSFPHISPNFSAFLHMFVDEISQCLSIPEIVGANFQPVLFCVYIDHSQDPTSFYNTSSMILPSAQLHLIYFYYMTIPSNFSSVFIRFI